MSGVCRSRIDDVVRSLTHTTPGEVRLLEGFGTIVWQAAGPFQIKIEPCDRKGRVIDAGWFWYNRTQRMDVFPSTGSVRHANLAIAGKSARLCVSGQDGATYCKLLARIPPGFGVYFYNSRPSVMFDNGYNGYGTAVYIKNRSLRFFYLSAKGPEPPP